MDDSGHRENGRQKPDVFKAAQSQWLMHQPSMKQIMSLIAERDAAIQERNMALIGRNKALEERDLAIMQRDAAIRERNEAIMERDNELTGVDYRQSPSCPPGCLVARGVKHMHHPQQHLLHQPLTGGEACYEPKQVTVAEAAPVTDVIPEKPKARKVKQPKERKPVPPNKKSSKPSKKAKTEVSGSDENKQLESSTKPDWKDQDLGLNQILFDETNMATPVCSCTGVYRHCYKWGNGGWQSACCTTTMSMYPLPPVPNKRHARVGGRKMSGSAFSKLLSRLAAEGHDLSVAVDLKEHWAKHGTNRYITIR